MIEAEALHKHRIVAELIGKKLREMGGMDGSFVFPFIHALKLHEQGILGIHHIKIKLLLHLHHIRIIPVARDLHYGHIKDQHHYGSYDKSGCEAQPLQDDKTGIQKDIYKDKDHDNVCKNPRLPPAVDKGYGYHPRNSVKKEILKGTLRYEEGDGRKEHQTGYPKIGR